MAYWILATHPDRFRVLDSVLERDEEWWRTGGRPLGKGDLVAIWKYKGGEPRRGVVGFGEVLTDPLEMELRDEDDPYWIPRSDSLPAVAPRVRVRYARPPRVPVWLGQSSGSVVDELPVARAQGGTAFRVTDDQWQRLIEEAGGWPSAVPDDVAGDAKAVEQVVRRRGYGQGVVLDAARRRAIERRAMDVVTAAYEAAGWTVRDVSATSPYDLLCHRGDEWRRVEVKGTTGSPTQVLLTANEVAAARADPASAALAVVHAISIVGAGDGLLGEGGVLTLLEPFDIDAGSLTPLAYRYAVPR